jgi:tape measure domain-containing protein
MSNIVEFTYKLVDKVSGTMGVIAKSATNVATNMQKTSKGFETAARSAQDLNAKMNPLQSSFDGLIKKGVAFFGITEGIRAGGAFFELGMNMEENRAKFEVLLGSAAKGNKMISDLNKMADITPFENGDLIKNSETMLAFGISAKKILPTLDMIGNVSMGNKEKLQGLTLAYSQVSSTGRLMGQDLLQMINQGFNPLLIMSQKTGKSMAQLKDDMEKGKISFAMVENAFKTATAEGGQFHGMMDKMSETGRGKLSTFMGNLKAKLTEVAERLNPLIVKIMNFAIAAVANFDKIGNIIWTILLPIRALFTGLSTIFNFFNKNRGALVAFVAILAIYNIITWQAALATKGWTIATILQYNWLLLVEKAQKLLSMTMLKNPLTAMLVGITLVVGALVMWKKRTQEMSQSYADAAKASAEYFHKERTYLDAQFVALQKTNTGSKERNRLVDELKARYPGLNDELERELRTSNNLNSAKSKMIELIKKEAIAKGFQSILFEKGKEISEAMITAAAEEEANKSIVDRNKKTKANRTGDNPMNTRFTSTIMHAGNYDLEKTSDNAAKKLKEKEKEFADIQKVMDAKQKDLGFSATSSDDTGTDIGVETGGTGTGKKSGGKVSVGDLTGGGSRATNVTINLRNLIENYNLHTENFKEGVDQGTQVLIEALLRVVNSSNKIVTQ